MQPGCPRRDVRTALLHPRPGPPQVWLLHSSHRAHHKPQLPAPGPASTLAAEGTANPALWDRSPQASSMLSTTASVLCPAPSVLPWVVENKARQPGREEERPQRCPVTWQHQPPSLGRMPTGKLTRGAAWWCPLNPPGRVSRLGQLLLCRGGSSSADQPRGGLQGGQPPRSTPR